MHLAVFLLLFLAIPAMHAQEHPSPSVVHADAQRIVRNGEPLFEVNATSLVRATPEQTWDVLTDYGRLPQYVPDLLSVTLLSREGNTVRIEQRSSTGFLFLTHTVRMVLHIVETPRTTIDVVLVEGDMHHYNTRWDIEPAEQGGAIGTKGTRITFSGVMEPKFALPPLIGSAIVEANLKRTVEAVVAEIERRTVH